MPWNRPPLATRSSGGRSMCRIPAPAVIHWVAPLVIRPPPPMESWCWKGPVESCRSPSRTLGAGAMGCPWAHRGRTRPRPSGPCARRGPSPRRVPQRRPGEPGSPPPSSPWGAVVTWATGRKVATVGSGVAIFGSVRGLSTVTAGMSFPPSRGPPQLEVPDRAPRPQCRCLPIRIAQHGPPARHSRARSAQVRVSLVGLEEAVGIDGDEQPLGLGQQLPGAAGARR